MTSLLSATIATVFVILALWHFWMAASPRTGRTGAVPSAGGKPLFVPSRPATFGVGVVLLLFATLVATTGRVIDLGLPWPVLHWLSLGLAAGLLARGVGEFRYVGMFKRVRGSRFATLDTFVYSPLCLLLAAGTAWVAMAGA